MPEGDTIFKAARRVRDAIGGRQCTDIALPRVTSPPPEPGATVVEVSSHGKYLVITLDDDHVIVTHLKMTGEWRVLRQLARDADGRARRPPSSRLRVWLATEEVAVACLDAPVAELLDVAALRRHRGIRALGPDLCLIDAADQQAHLAAFDEIVRRAATHAMRDAPITDVLLDQRVAAGIGNVYKSEICFLHGLHPDTPAQRVDEATRRALFVTGAELLQANLETSQRTTVPGARPGSLWVYGRAGRACRRCGTAIETHRSGRQHRVTSWCPACQPSHASTP